jgi:hypothetical protein
MFNAKDFAKAQFAPRTAELSLPALADYFDGDPVWTVRGATASEIAKMLEAGAKQNNIDNIIKAIAANKDKVNEIREAVGIVSDTPADIVKRLEQLVMCSVEPVIELPIAVKLADAFPVEFYMLTNKITELTGQGMDVKKSKASGKTLKSEG